jgi:hypothetical protein
MSTTTAKPPPRMRINSNAVLFPQARFQAWHDQAILTAGLTELDRAILAEIVRWYRALYVQEFAGSLSFERMARRLDVDAVQVRWAVERLVELGLVAIKPGAGGRANTYLPALPRGLAASLATAASDDAPLF